MNFLLNVTWLSDSVCMHVTFLATYHLVVEWICWWNLFCILTGDEFQKAYLEEWHRVDDGQMRPLQGQFTNDSQHY